MESLPGASRIDFYKKVQLLCDLRLEGTHSEDEIAKQLEFGSSEAMRVQLENWGLSGLLRDTGGTVDTGDKRRKASSSGDVKALPTVAQAEPLFRSDLMLMTHYVNQVPSLQEYLQGKRFASFSWVGEDWEYYRRDEFSEEEWKRLCEDPTEEIIRAPISPYLARGSGPTPWEGLTFLIAMHALMNESVDRLVKALQSDSTSINLADLYKRKGKEGATQDGVITALKKAAAQLAATLRGSKLSSGTHNGEVLPLEAPIALAVTELAKEGHSPEAIYQELKERRLLDEMGRYWVQPENKPARKEKYTLDDVKRHIKVGLLPPS